MRLVPLLGDRDVTGIKGCVPLKNWIDVLNMAHDLLTNLSKTSEGQLAAHPLQKGGQIRFFAMFMQLLWRLEFFSMCVFHTLSCSI